MCIRDRPGAEEAMEAAENAAAKTLKTKAPEGAKTEDAPGLV